ncbi:MAG: Zn-dependent alcohol dehydrogenase [Acidimicrobiales bacterium]|nr:Zn-dependent alcohol dehydrogenase [Acidimicrobiales bacterium]
MKAAVLNQMPGELEIEDIAIDTPGPDEVLLRTSYAGLCHSDLHFMDGVWQMPPPAIMGHEAAGVVEQVGENVRYVAPGDHVITCLSIFCGQCKQCLSGHMSRCTGAGEMTARPRPSHTKADGTPCSPFARLGAFAEQMLVHQNAVVKITKDMPLDRASLIGCGVTTGLGAVFRTARVEPGSTVAVLGAGGIGLAAIQGARIAGASRIIAVDLVDSKLELARQLGATHVVNGRDTDPVLAVKELSDGGVDYSFEAIGLKQTTEQSWAMLGLGGTATVIGMRPIGTMIELPGYEIFMTEKKIQGSLMGSNQYRTDMPRFIELYLDGRLKLDEMVSAHIPLEAVNEGYAAMKRGEVARTVIDFGA